MRPLELLRSTWCSRRSKVSSATSLRCWLAMTRLRRSWTCAGVRAVWSDAGCVGCCCAARTGMRQTATRVIAMAHPDWSKRFMGNEDSLPFRESRMMALEKRFLYSFYRFSHCSDICFHCGAGLDDWYRERHLGHSFRPRENFYLLRNVYTD